MVSPFVPRNKSAIVRLFDNLIATTCLVIFLVILCQPGLASTPLVVCSTGALGPGDQTNPPDLVIYNGSCVVNAGTYYYHNVNILNGYFYFADAKIDFWAASILVQNKGFLLAGSRTMPIKNTVTIHLWGPDGGGDATSGSGHQTGGKGIVCLMPDGKGGFIPDKFCGVPSDVWSSNGGSMQMNHMAMAPGSCTKKIFNGINDCFYPYAPIDFDDGDPIGYFGYKVLAVSYGGWVGFFGSKGATYPATKVLPPADSGTSWVRLGHDLNGGETQIVVDRDVSKSWAVGDNIVVSTTDYLPGHSEELQIVSFDPQNATKINVTALNSPNGKIQWPHNGTKYDLKAKGIPDRVAPDGPIGPTDDPNLPAGNGRLVDTRAAVALLTRNIRIVSGCDKAGQPFPAPNKDCTGADASTSYYFGGHTIARQGFAQYQVQGVEFYQLGQGGRIMHYPVHFHMARKTPQLSGQSGFTGTYIKDSSVWDSMTRWYTIHATQGVVLGRNVGYKSIGHGYYLEDGTETDNQFYSNLGIFARAAVDNAQNERKVPGILAGGYVTQPGKNEDPDLVPFTSDADHPTLFWITNGWNDFQYNMAAGANTCGVCYWLVPAGNSGMSQMQQWESYASEQAMSKTSCHDDSTNRDWTCDDFRNAGTTPVKKFVGNFCSTAESSFLSVSVTTSCRGVVPTHTPYLDPIPNTKIPPTPPLETTYTADQDRYYPKVDPAGSRAATLCPPTGDCSVADGGGLKKCAAGQPDRCMPTVIDHYTSSFNWAEQNFSAIWLRPQWYLLSNSAITDVQTGGVTMITGGDYTNSSVIPGYWGLTRNSVFIGHTQDPAKGNYYAYDSGPFNPESKQATASSPNPLECEGTPHAGDTNSHCLDRSEGMTMPLSNFAVNQRLFNIYDGPAYQDLNAYLDITHTPLKGCNPGTGAACPEMGWMYGNQQGLPLDATQTDATLKCYMPNAAIAWKHPNGFFYPPAFHSRGLYFSNGDVRHFVVDPPFKPTDVLHPFSVDPNDLTARYCVSGYDMFGGYGGGTWTGIDRQTELTDDDGSLSGLVSKQKQNGDTQEVIMVNEEPFFKGPFEDYECESDINASPLSGKGTVKDSPYEYVTTVIYPACNENCGVFQGKDSGNYAKWNKDCTSQICYGVPLYREFQTKSENGGPPRFMMMMGAAIAQRNTLTVNHGNYYIDATVSLADQDTAVAPLRPHQTPPPVKAYTNYTGFEAGQKYYTFLLYAKPTTKQTYQIFIGTGLDKTVIESPSDTTVSAAQVNKAQTPFSFTDLSWPGTWTKTYDPPSGIVSVTMDFSDTAIKSTPATQCQPVNFCTGNGNSCKCKLTTSDPTHTPSIKAQCDAACGTWAVKDVDCPDAGCYGFSVTLPQAFQDTIANAKVPNPVPFPDTTDWNLGFDYAPKSSGGCKYPSLPKYDH